MRFGVFKTDLDPAAAIRELHGIRDHIPQDLLQPFRVARHWRLISIEDALETNPSRIGCRAHGLDALLNDGLQIDGSHVQSDFSGNDSRDIQHVLDDFGQRCGVSLDDFHRAPLLIHRDQARTQHPRVSQDRVQRRTQFVRQRRQKVVFEAARFLRHSQQSRALGFSLLPLGDVTRNFRRANHDPVGIANRRDGQRDRKQRPILSAPNRLEMLDSFAAMNPGNDVVFLRLPIVGNDRSDRAADHFIGCITEDSLGCTIPRKHDAAEILADDGIVAGFDNRGKAQHASIDAATGA